MTVPVAPGDIVAGRYRIERVLGQGGMGVVVAARHLQLGEPVAIKFPLTRSVNGRDMGARVVREGRAAARLRGEHVARVMDVGTLDSGDPFIVFELLRGSDLETTLEARGQLPLHEALEHVLQACEALAEAHAIGIVHRDLKPANLFLTKRPDGSPSIKIIDFGIAKARDADTEGAPAATESFMIFGTPLYMSPEQMRSSKDVDARSDIWSLGAVLHHLLAGKPPFPPKSLPEIYQLAQAGPPPIRSVRSDVPEAVEAALLRCMAASPADRFADVAELAEALAVVAPARAAVSAERARRILAAAESTRDGAPDPDRSSSGDLDAAAGDRSRAADGKPLGSSATEDPGSTDPAPLVGIAPTLEAGRAPRPGAPPAEPTSAAAQSIHSEPAQSTIAAVKIDVTSNGAAPRPRPSPALIAVAVVLALAAAVTVGLLARPDPSGAPVQAASGVTRAQDTTAIAAPARTDAPVTSSSLAAATPPAVVTVQGATSAVVTPSSAALPLGVSAPSPAAPAASTSRPKAPPRSTVTVPAGPAHAGPLDDPN